MRRLLSGTAALCLLPWLTTTPVAGDELRLAEAVVTPIDRWEVPARTAGALRQVQVTEGTRVHEGDLLASIADDEARLAVEHAHLMIRVAEAQARNDFRVSATARAADVAKAELARAQESEEKYKKSVSQTELDRLRLTVEQTELEHQQARHERDLAGMNVDVRRNELASAERALQRHHIVAPAEGIVVEVLRRTGEWVEPSTTVIRITRTDRLRVEAFLDARRHSLNLVGAPIRFESANLGADAAKPVVYEGRLTFISPEANPVNGQVRVWAEIENTDGRLRHGLSGTLIVQLPDGVSNPPEPPPATPAPKPEQPRSKVK